MFSWWKTKKYSHIMGMDDELWDILEQGVGDLKLDEEGAALDEKAHTAEQKKLYKKHHTIRGIMVAALPHKQYLAKMAMLSNKLQYLAKKNKRFLSKGSSHKSSRKEEKGCFNYKKT